MELSFSSLIFVKIKNNSMQKSFLKTSSTQLTNTVAKETGELLEQEEKKMQYLANSKEEFYIIYSSLIGIITNQLTGPEIRVYAWLLMNYKSSSDISVSKAIRERIGIGTGLKEKTVANVLTKLLEYKLVYSPQKGIYKLNPRYAYQGSTVSRNQELKAILELVCPDC